MEAERPSYMEPEAPPDAATVELAKARLIAQIMGAEAVERAARVLAEFAKTAPGRLPSRVQEAIETIRTSIGDTPAPQSKDGGEASEQSSITDAQIDVLWEHYGGVGMGLQARQSARAVLAQQAATAGVAPPHTTLPSDRLMPGCVDETGEQQCKS